VPGRIFGLRREEVTSVEKTAQRDGLKFVIFTKYDWDDQIKENDMNGACSMHGRNEKCIHFSRKT
jgi:hypothetical protein